MPWASGLLLARHFLHKQSAFVHWPASLAVNDQVPRDLLDGLSWGLVGYSFFLLAVAMGGDTHGTFSLDLMAAGSPELQTGAPG